MSAVYATISQVLAIVAALLLAPLLTGWVNMCRAWLQNRSAPSLLQPYRMLHKLFVKESVVAEHASPIFQAACLRTSWGARWCPSCRAHSIRSWQPCR